QPSDQFRQILCRQSLSCNDPPRTVGHQRYRFEILHHIVLKPVGGTIHDMRRPVAENHHVPSGAARATRPVPMVPPAPVGFSMITDCPSGPLIRSARMRASVSVGPPAEKGTTMVMGRDG